MRITDFPRNDQQIIEQTARLMVEAFREHHPEAWPTIELARQEVLDSFAEDRISRIALDGDGSVLGWIGGIEAYNGHTWELHPLVVSPAAQGRGIGRVLVADLESQVAARGGITLYLGTDDENYQTSLGGVDLYPNPIEHVADVKNLRQHPFEFYQKLGFVIVGVMPDANGFGKPDIFMAKRIGGLTSKTP